MLHRWFCRMCRGLPRSKPLSGRPGLRMAILLSVSGAVRAGSGRILGPTCSPLILVAQCSSTALPGNYISQPVAGLGVMSLVVGTAGWLFTSPPPVKSSSAPGVGSLGSRVKAAGDREGGR